MRRLVWLATAGVALAAAGVAVADGIGTKSIKSLTASFTATSVSESRARTCTNADGTWVLTRALYSGTSSSSDPDFNGPILLWAQSLINTTKKLGVVDGNGRVRLPGPDTTFKFSGVYSNDQLNGLLGGNAHEPSERVVGNLSASFSAASGFTNGKLGDTAAGGAAVDLERGRCQPAQAQPRQRVEAKGTVSAVSSTSITVVGVTCVVPPDLAEKVGKLKVGDRAEIRCEVINNQLTLVKVEKKGGEKDDD